MSVSTAKPIFHLQAYKSNRLCDESTDESSKGPCPSLLEANAPSYEEHPLISLEKVKRGNHRHFIMLAYFEPLVSNFF
jgi:hypothetical protein